MDVESYSGILQIRTRNEDEENTKHHGNNHRYREGHGRAFVEEFLDVWLTNPGPVHEGVFTEPKECHQRIEFVLIGHHEISSEGEGKDQLERRLAQ